MACRCPRCLCPNPSGDVGASRRGRRPLARPRPRAPDLGAAGLDPTVPAAGVPPDTMEGMDGMIQTARHGWWPRGRGWLASLGLVVGGLSLVASASWLPPRADRGGADRDRLHRGRAPAVTTSSART